MPVNIDTQDYTNARLHIHILINKHQGGNNKTSDLKTSVIQTSDFHRTSKTFNGLHEASNNFTKLHQTSRDFQRLLEISLVFQRPTNCMNIKEPWK